MTSTPVGITFLVQGVKTSIRTSPANVLYQYIELEGFLRLTWPRGTRQDLCISETFQLIALAPKIAMISDVSHFSITRCL